MMEETSKTNNRIVVIFIILIVGLSAGVVYLKKEHKEETTVQENLSKNISLSQEDNDIVCAEVMIKIYSDKDYNYYVPTACYGDYVYVTFDDGTKMSINEAINENKVSIEDLIKAGASITKVSLNDDKEWQLKTIPSGLTCAQVVTKMYEDDNFTYEVPNPCYMNETYVVYSNGEQISIKDAVEEKKVTIDELISAGASITKTSKVVINSWTLQSIPNDKACAEVVTTLYEDTKYRYTVGNQCYIDNTFVVYTNKTKINIKEALDKKKVTIDELIKAGAPITKEEKVASNTWTLKTISSGTTCAQVVTTLYEDTTYKYTVSNPCYITETYVVYGDGTKYNLKEALSKKKVTINELIKAGAKITKTKKTSSNSWTLKNFATGDCVQVEAVFYEDDNYKYTVPTPCYPEEWYVVYSNGTKYTIKEAVEKKKVTIDELIKAGAKIGKEPKTKQKWTLKTIHSDIMCAQVITTIYEDANYKYTVSTPCYIAETYVVFTDGTKYNIKEAIDYGYVTADELIKAGADIGKEPKAKK